MASAVHRRVMEYRYAWTIEDFYKCLISDIPLATSITHVTAKSWIQFRLKSTDLTLEEGTLSVTIDKNDELDIALGDCDLCSSRNASSPTAFTKRRLSYLPGWQFYWETDFPELFKQGNVTITCFLFLGETKFASSCSDIHLMKLSRDISRLIDSGEFSDLKLSGSDYNTTNQSFNVHRPIIAIRAPELARLLNLEWDSDPVKVVDVTTTAVLKFLIDFWYTGRLDISMDKIPAGLHSAMQLLNLDDLKGKLCIYPNHAASVSKIKTICHGFRWPIKNFTKLLPEKKLTSPVLYQSRFNTLQLKLHLKSARTVSGGEDINIYLCRIPSIPETKRRLSFHVAVVNIFGELVNEASFVTDSTHVSNASLSIKTSEFDDLLSEDTLLLQINMVLEQADNEVHESSYTSTSIEDNAVSLKNLDNLSSALGDLLKSKHFSDFKITAGGKKLYLHNCILKARSQKIFEYLAENRESFGVHKSNITDMDGDVLQKIITYIYTGNVEILDCGMATKLYLVAFKNDLHLLKDKCLSFIRDNMIF